MADTLFCRLRSVALIALLLLGAAAPALASQPPDVAQAPTTEQPGAARHGGGEANLVLPDLGSVSFQGVNGRTLLMGGLAVAVLGLAFGLVIYRNLKNMPVHRSMLEISELIYETCKTYLITQGKFIAILWVFIAVIIGLYFGYLAPPAGHPVAQTVLIILAFSVIGILGSYGVAWFGIR